MKAKNKERLLKLEKIIIAICKKIPIWLAIIILVICTCVLSVIAMYVNNFLSQFFMIIIAMCFFMFCIIKQEGISYRKYVGIIVLIISIIYIIGVVGYSMILIIPKIFQTEQIDKIFNLYTTVFNTAITSIVAIAATLIGVKSNEKNKHKENLKKNINILECLKIDIDYNISCCHEKSQFENIDLSIWELYRQNIIELFLYDKSLVKNTLDLYRNLSRIKVNKTSDIDFKNVKGAYEKIVPHIDNLINKFKEDNMYKYIY